MKKINVRQLQKLFWEAACKIISKEPYLTEIDSIIGDGDHGIGMLRGFSAVKQLLETDQFKYADDLCYAVSIELIRTMGGASGVIFGTMFLGGVSVLPHDEWVTGRQLALYFAEGEKAIEKRGKARPGQKTMLDALYPACEAMVSTSRTTDNVATILEEGYKGSLKGVENSKEIQSLVGRSKNFREKTVGLPDPGAVSTSFLFEAFYETVKYFE